MSRHETTPQAPAQAAPGLWWMTVGKGLMKANVYFVRSGPGWGLIDAGSAGCGPVILKAATSLFGDAAPTGIFMTHYHPDHTGSVRELAGMWDCPVWLDRAELELVLGGLSTLERYAGPLDRWFILPLMRLMGERRWDRMAAKTRFREYARALDCAAELPGLPGWTCIHSPGHTPGHAAFFRAGDRVLVTGDALLTVDINSVWGIVRRRPKLCEGPWYTAWDRRLGIESAAALRALEPRVVAPGHGAPMILE